MALFYSAPARTLRESWLVNRGSWYVARGTWLATASFFYNEIAAALQALQ
jgi:hypothetical protein